MFLLRGGGGKLVKSPEEEESPRPRPLRIGSLIQRFPDPGSTDSIDFLPPEWNRFAQRGQP